MTFLLFCSVLRELEMLDSACAQMTAVSCSMLTYRGASVKSELGFYTETLRKAYVPPGGQLAASCTGHHL